LSEGSYLGRLSPVDQKTVEVDSLELKTAGD
jgi:hypothetical protein